jgi:hypothetical protein
MGQRQDRIGDGTRNPSQPKSRCRAEFLGHALPCAQAGTLCFPAERYGAGGDEFSPKAYHVDPSKPIGNIKEAWEAAKLRAGKILNETREGRDGDEADKALACRFHDLRHTAVSRMLNAGIPIAKVAKIAGWNPATMVRMAARDGHFSLDELRGAVESISGSRIETKSPVFSPVSNERKGETRPN